MNENEIYHHGIQGMKWGVKNGPPYPLGKTVSNGKKLLNQGTSRHAERRPNDNVGMDPVTAVALTYIAAFALLPVAASKAARIKMMRDLEKKKEQRQFREVDDVPRLKRKEKPAESMKVTNPGYPRQGTTMNCMCCTTAMAMREKGYDVSAVKSNFGYPDKMMEKCWNTKTVKMPKMTSSESIQNELQKLGEGAYGNIIVSWKAGGAHSLFFKNEGGRTHIYDGQAGEEIEINKKVFDRLVPNGSRYHRLDDCDPTEYALGVIQKRKVTK